MADAPGFAAEASPYSDDDRSSSLSDLDEGADAGTMPEHIRKKMAVNDGDSEAETERLEVSPNKPVKEENALVNSLPLAQTLMDLSNDRAGGQTIEAERFSDSEISSPAPSEEDILSDGNSDQNAELQEMDYNGPEMPQTSLGKKRKRSEQEDEIDTDEDEENRLRRKRTGSVRSDAEIERPTSDDERSSVADSSREGSPDAMEVADDQEDELVVDANEEETLTGAHEAGDFSAKSKKGRDSNSHLRVSQHEDSEGRGISQAEEDQIEAAGESEEEDLAEADDAEDAEAAARSEEERKRDRSGHRPSSLIMNPDAKRTAAMDALLALEKRFAALRDR